MPRRMMFSLVFLAATAGLVWAGWPGAAANPATLINRIDVIAAVVMLAGLPWLARRLFGPGGW
jgi:ABC-type xylose transport system permease subunit